ncbi:cyclic nucleotide-binding domain-containing protein [Alsobacter sp. R-9]
MFAQSYRDKLRAVSFFCEMSAISFEKLISESLVIDYPNKSTIIKNGDYPDFLLYVMSGVVEIHSDSGRSSSTVGIMGPGQLIYLAATLLQEPALSEARALADCRILMIPSRVVTELVNTDVGFCKKLLMSSIRSNRTLIRDLNNQKLRNSLERLGSWILHEHLIRNSNEFAIPFKKQTLAGIIGSTQENLSRLLVQISDHGVFVSRNVIRISDIDKLKDLVKPNLSTEVGHLLEAARQVPVSIQ